MSGESHAVGVTRCGARSCPVWSPGRVERVGTPEAQLPRPKLLCHLRKTHAAPKGMLTTGTPNSNTLGISNISKKQEATIASNKGIAIIAINCSMADSPSDLTTGTAPWTRDNVGRPGRSGCRWLERRRTPCTSQASEGLGRAEEAARSGADEVDRWKVTGRLCPVG